VPATASLASRLWAAGAARAGTCRQAARHGRRVPHAGGDRRGVGFSRWLGGGPSAAARRHIVAHRSAALVQPVRHTTSSGAGLRYHLPYGA